MSKQEHDDSQELSVLLERKKNVHGEIHLDRVLSELLIGWVRNYEDTFKAYGALEKDLIAIRDELKVGGSNE